MTQDKKRKIKIRALAAKTNMSYTAARRVLLGSATPKADQLIAGFSIYYGHGDLITDSRDRAKAEKLPRWVAFAPLAPLAFCSRCDLFVPVDHFARCELPVTLIGARRVIETHADRSARERKGVRRRQPVDKIATYNLFLPVAKEATTLHRGADDKDIRNPTLADILRELASLHGEDSDSFVIYGRDADPLSYMQVHGGKDEFSLEYQAGTIDSHFNAEKILSLVEVQNAFVWYASGDERWKTSIAWEKQITRPPALQQPRQPSTETEGYWLTKRHLNGDYPKIGAKGGKWLIFVDRSEVDGWWEKISSAVDAGLLGQVAQVSTARPNPNSADPARHVICVYSYDHTDTADVARIRGALRDLGVKWTIYYKTNRATAAGLYKVRGDTRISDYWE